MLVLLKLNKSLFIDFIINLFLNMLCGIIYNIILVIINCFIKLSIFIFYKKSINTKKLVDLVIKKVFNIYKYLNSIIFNKRLFFISKF